MEDESDLPKPAAASGGLLAIPGLDVLEEIARGGMGIVYRARQLDPPRTVALKMLLPHQLGVKDMAERFRLEARALATLDHPGILPVHQFGVHDGMPFFTMKFAPGGTLAQRKSSFAGAWQRIAELLAALVDAVQFAHERGVLHRDLKPGNVLFDESGRAFLSDFGLAKLINADTAMTRSVDFLGTPHYVAPEVAEGNAARATTASDIYALGAILYELLAGRPPFEAESIPALLRKITEEEAPRPCRVAESEEEASSPQPSPPPAPPKRFAAASRRRRGSSTLTSGGRQVQVPRDLEVICLKCLTKEPSRRYGSARELAEDLRRWLEGRPILARPVTHVERMWRWSLRNPALAISSSFAAAIALAMLVVLLVSNARVQHERDSVVREQSVTRHNLYAADIFLAQRALEAGNLGLARRTLAPHKPTQPSSLNARGGTPGPQDDPRGFEWYLLWNQTHGDQIATLTNHTDAVLSVAFWDSHTGQPRARCEGHTGRVLDMAFSPNGRMLATASADQSVRLWATDSGREIKCSRGHLGEVLSVAFSPDGNIIASASRDHTVRLWSTVLAPVPDDSMRLYPPLVMSRDGKTLAGFGSTYIKSATSRTCQFWDVLGEQPQSSFKLGRFVPVIFASDGRTVGAMARPVSGGPLSFRFLDPSGRTNPAALTLETSSFAERSTTASPDGKTFAVGDYDGRITLWDTANGQRRSQWQTHSDWVDLMAFSPDGQTLASFGHNLEMILWDVSTMQARARLGKAAAPVESMAFSPDAQLLATAGQDNEVQLWNTISGRKWASLVGHQEAVLRVAFAPDGRTLASASADGSVKLWHVAARREMATFDRAETVVFLAFTPDGQTLVSGSREGHLHSWRAPRPEPAAEVATAQSLKL